MCLLFCVYFWYEVANKWIHEYRNWPCGPRRHSTYDELHYQREGASGVAFPAPEKRRVVEVEHVSVGLHSDQQKSQQD